MLILEWRTVWQNQKSRQTSTECATAAGSLKWPRIDDVTGENAKQNREWELVSGNHFYTSLWVAIKDEEVMLTEQMKFLVCMLRKLLPQIRTPKFSFVMPGELKRRLTPSLCSLAKAVWQQCHVHACQMSIKTASPWPSDLYFSLFHSEAHPKCSMSRHTCLPLAGIMIQNNVCLWRIKQDSLSGYCWELNLAAQTLTTQAGSWSRTWRLTVLILGKVV